MVRALITPNSTIIQIHQYPELEMKISKIPNSQNSEFNQISRLCNQNNKKKKANKHQNRKFKIRNLLLDSSEIGRRHSTHLLLSEPYHLWIHHSVKHSSSLSLSLQTSITERPKSQTHKNSNNNSFFFCRKIEIRESWF